MTNKPVLLSILIPVYNVESYIRATVESLFDQHDPRVEYVLVNDGSTDGSWGVLQTVLAEHPELGAATHLLEHEKNSGVEMSRITALSVASGKYVWFVDSDDVIAPGAVKAILTALEDADPDYLALKFRTLRPGENFGATPATYRHYPIDCRKLFKRIIFSNSLQHAAWVNIVRRKLTIEHPMLRTGLKIAEDYTMHSYWSSFAQSAVSLVPAAYGYVQRKQSATGSNDLIFWGECVKQAVLALEAAFRREASESRRRELLRTLEQAKINLRMVFLIKIFNDNPASRHRELLKSFAGFFSPYRFWSGIACVPPSFLPILLFDRLKCYRLAKLYAHSARKARQILTASPPK